MSWNSKGSVHSESHFASVCKNLLEYVHHEEVGSLNSLERVCRCFNSDILKLREQTICPLAMDDDGFIGKMIQF